jgi:glycosyltransferase involved in cell wall biosynthesis
MSRQLSVTVIIPTFNRATLLPLAIDSVLSQSRVPEEIIVVDDGSTDDTPRLLARYNSPVKVITQPNSGRSIARNRGLRAATGDLIAFLDSDDLLPATSIARRAEILEQRPDIDIVYSEVLLIDAAGNEIGLYNSYLPGPRPSGMIFVEMARRDFIPIHAAMIRRSSLRDVQFEENLEQAEDFDFWLRLATRCRFQYVSEPLAYYRWHETATTVSQPRKMLESEVKVQKRVFNMPAFQQLKAHEKAYIYCSHGVKNAMLGQLKAAQHYFTLAIVTAPTYPVGYVLMLFSMAGVRAFQYFITKRRQLVGNQAASRVLPHMSSVL